MSIIDGIQNVLGTIMRVGQVVVPMLRSLRGVSDEIDDAFTAIDGAIEEGGEVADDFFDRNLSTVGDMREFFIDLRGVGDRGEALCDRVITASQVDTPDLITVEEGQELAELSNELRVAFKALVTKNEELEGRIASIK